MPSPFPGMDPFLETQLWADFQNEMIVGIRATLMPQLRPRCVARIEERVYFGQERETFLEVRLPESQQVVTVIEVLSPANKRLTSRSCRSSGRRPRGCTNW